MSLRIFYEDSEIIVCEKPVGVPSQSDKSLTADLASQLKNYLYEKEGKANPYVAVVHRLDRAVGGVMVYARTKEAAAHLSRQVQDGTMHKEYLTVVTKDLSHLKNKEGMLSDYMVKDGRSNTSRIVEKGVKDAKEARLQYHFLASGDVAQGEERIPVSLLKITLLTGRHHQIRLQMSKHFQGVWGDTKYNPFFRNKRGWYNVALFAYSLSFVHPKTKKEIGFKTYPSLEPFTQFPIKSLLEDKQ